MITIATSTHLITSAFADVGTILILVLVAPVSAIITLLGLGFALRHTHNLMGGSAFGAWADRMTYHPFAGSHRGYWYRMPESLRREWMP